MKPIRIVFHCICGRTHQLELDINKKLYVIGCLDEPYIDLQLCRDDTRMLSRVQCHIRYINNLWMIFDGCPQEIPLPLGKQSPQSACGTYVIKEGEIFQATNTNGIPLETADIICFVPISGITVLYKGQPVECDDFAYRGVVTEITLAEEDIDEFSMKLQKRSELIPKEPAIEIIREKFSEIYELSTIIANQQYNPQEVFHSIISFLFNKIPATTAVGIISVQPDGSFNVLAGRVNFLPTFKFSTTIAKMVVSKKTPIVSTNILAEPQFKDFVNQLRQKSSADKHDVVEASPIAHSIDSLSIESVIVIPLLEGENVIGLLWLDNRKGNKVFTEADFYLAVAVSNLVQLQLLYEKYKSLALLRANIERFFCPKVLDWLTKKVITKKEIKLSVHEYEVTILFVDIVGSTQLSVEITPQTFNEYLTPHYYRTISEAVFAFDGHVNDFMGDGVLAIFGDIIGIDEKKEIHKSKYAIDAVNSALKMVDDWSKITPQLQKDIRIRIGIHTGRAAVGTIGYEKRMEYTAVGKDVNIACHLQRFAEPNSIVISDYTYNLVKNNFECVDLGEKEVRGLSGKLRLWKVIGRK